jgi:hypothetical protein
MRTILPNPDKAFFPIINTGHNTKKEKKMLDDSELIIEDLDFSSTRIEYYDIEINSPVTDEDIRYAQLEEIIFRKNVNEFKNTRKLLFCVDPAISRTTIN